MKRLTAAAALAMFLALTPAAAQSDADAISQLLTTGNAQLNGDGVPQDLNAAIDSFTTALTQLGALTERRIADEIFAQNQLGFALHMAERYAEAADHFSAAYDLMVASGHQNADEITQVRFNRAIAWRLSGQQDLAIPEFIALLPDFEKLPPPQLFERRGTLSYHLGMSLMETARPADARQILQLAFDDLVSVEQPDGAFLAEIVMHIGSVAADTGDFTGAVKEYEKALEIFKLLSAPDPYMQANVLTRLGVAKRALGNYAEALDAHGKALDLVEKAGGPRHPLAAEIRVNRGVVFGAMDKRAEALAEFELAQAIYAEAYGPQSKQVADTIYNIGGLHYDDGDYSRAIENFQQALAIYEAMDPQDPMLVATTLSNIGAVYTTLYAFDDALAVLDRAMKLMPPDNRHMLDLRSNHTAVLVRLGRHEEALAAFPPLISDYTKALGENSLEVARSTVNYGSLLSAMGRHAEALEQHRKGYDIFSALFGPRHSLTISAAGNVGYSELMNGHPEEGFAAIAQVLAARGEGGDARFAYEMLGIFAVAMQLPTTTMLFGKMAVNAQRAELQANSDLSQNLLEKFAGRFGGIHTALAEGLIADGLFSEAQFVNSLLKKEEFAAFTRGAASEAPQPGEDRIALTASEQAIAAKLQDLIGGARAALDKADAAFQAGGAGKDAARGELARALAGSGVSLALLVQETESQRAAIQAERLAQNSQRMAEARGQLQALGGEAVLYHAVSLDTELHLMLTRADLDQPVHRTVAISRKDLAAKVYAALEAIESRDDGAVEKLQELDRLLIAPLRDELEKAPGSVVMFDVAGFLRYVPFAALHDGERYLAESHALAAFGGISAASESELGTGSAGFGTTKAHGDFSALPGVAKELEAIFVGADGKGFLDGDARLDEAFTLDALRTTLQSHPRYVHIGSHFRFTPGNETGSSLLIGTGEEVGMDVFRTDPALKFSGVDLLVLSACETARGSGAEGAEIESLGALARSNGARAVMATLWPIADEASAKIMADFYQGLVKDGLDKARALQRAQIAMIRNVEAGEVAVGQRGVTSTDEEPPPVAASAGLAHPYYWSPFVLMGQWN